MTTTNGGNGSNGGNGAKPVGYKSPPERGRIKKGEVRNPFGRNGRSARKPDVGDPFEKVRRRLTRVTIEGETMMITSDEAFFMVHFAKALAGNPVSSRIIYKELAARRDLSPPALTAEELAQLEAEQADRKRMAENIMDALDDMAAQKRRDGLAQVKYGPDGKPILDGPAWTRPAEPSDDFSE